MAAATMATTMAMLGAKCHTTKSFNPFCKPTKPAVSLLSLQKLPKLPENTAALTGTALAGAIFSTLSAAEPALAVQQLAEIADGDNRGLALLIPIIPAILWVLYNILQPALNQINKMTSSKGVIVGLGLGGLAASGLLHPADASAAGEMAVIGEAVSDSRGQLLLFVITPAILWVLYNIFKPALNQINKMRS
ncbi:photosystem II reaction center proteins PsbY, chloroplastic-like [Primulina eburnea]|uniref:photosystem II reaction center proteins PsbY, chloroplastic-like n=1 Tax=Primulina eburnea TaxID=1245227 RepID=UPI003C6CC064